MPDFGRVSLIEASPHNPGGGLRGGEELSERRSQALHLQDRRLRQDVDQDRQRHSRRRFRARRARRSREPGLLFAGTEHGIYVSFDDGAQWQSIRLNLPDMQVSDMVIEGNDVVIATHGRSFYVLDDITPLRQLTPTLSSEDAHLFHPPDGRAQREPGAHRLLPGEARGEGPDRHSRCQGPGGPHLHRHAQRSGWAWGRGGRGAAPMAAPRRR